jgi:hypothetical protein
MTWFNQQVPGGVAATIQRKGLGRNELFILTKADPHESLQPNEYVTRSALR